MFHCKRPTKGRMQRKKVDKTACLCYSVQDNKEVSAFAVLTLGQFAAGFISQKRRVLRSVCRYWHGFVVKKPCFFMGIPRLKYGIY